MRNFTYYRSVIPTHAHDFYRSDGHVVEKFWGSPNRWTVEALHPHWFGPNATPLVEGLVDVTKQTGAMPADPPLSESEVSGTFARLIMEHTLRSDQHDAATIARLWAEFRHLRSLVGNGGDTMSYTGGTLVSQSAMYRQVLASNVVLHNPDATP